MLYGVFKASYNGNVPVDSLKAKPDVDVAEVFDFEVVRMSVKAVDELAQEERKVSLICCVCVCACVVCLCNFVRSCG